MANVSRTSVDKKASEDQSTDTTLDKVMDTSLSLREEGSNSIAYDIQSTTYSMSRSLRVVQPPRIRHIPYDARSSSASSSRRRRFLVARSRLFWSCRLILSVISCLGFVTMYVLRFNFYVAMSCMIIEDVSPKQSSIAQRRMLNVTTRVSPPPCSNFGDNYNYRHGISGRHENIFTGEKKGDKLVWSSSARTVTKSSFFIGYCITQIPGGWLAERYGGKSFVGLSILFSGLFNLLIPTAAQANYMIVAVIRACMGLAQGVSWPAMFVVWSRWVTDIDRQKLNTLTYAGIPLDVKVFVSVFVHYKEFYYLLSLLVSRFSLSGSLLGIAITYPMVGILCEPKGGLGWPFVFYMPGGFAIVWCIAWHYLVFETPEMHPRISRSEKLYLVHNLRKTRTLKMMKHTPTPWKALMTSKPAVSLIVVHVFATITLYGLIINVIKYSTDVLGFSLIEAGMLNAMPYVGFFTISMLSAFAYDNVTAKHFISRTSARKVGNTLGTFVPAILIFTASYLTCEDRHLAALLIIVGISFCGFQYGAGYITNFVDLAPQHVGVFYGIANALSSIVSGFLSPLVISLITTDQPISSWQVVLMLFTCVFLIDMVIFLIFGSANLQSWAVTSIDDGRSSSSSLSSRDQSNLQKQQEQQHATAV